METAVGFLISFCSRNQDCAMLSMNGNWNKPTSYIIFLCK